MVGSGIGQIGQSQLMNPPQPLKLGGVNQMEQQIVQRALQVECDYVMDRIANDFFMADHGRVDAIESRKYWKERAWRDEQP
jgi:hypothetical protein